MSSWAIEGGLWLALSRGLAVAACLIVLGTMVFRLTVARPLLDKSDDQTVRRLHRIWLRLLWTSVACSLPSGLAWLVLQSADMASATTLGDALAATPLVILNSRFGQVLAARLIILAAAPFAAGRSHRQPRLILACGLAMAATALQASDEHAASMAAAPPGLVLSTVLHLLAAGIWLGQLPALCLFVAVAPPATAASALRRFSPLGVACVLILAGTAAFQGWVLVGGLPGFVGTAYGRMALTKLLLFGLLIAFAVANRYLFLPRMAAAPAETRTALIRSIALEATCGLFVVLAAGLLANLPPGMHEQPLWPSARTQGSYAFALAP